MRKDGQIDMNKITGVLRDPKNAPKIKQKYFINR